MSAATLETDIYDDLYGDSGDTDNVDVKESVKLESPVTEREPEPPSPTLSATPETKVLTGESSLPAKPTELSYSAQIAKQFSAYKQTPAQERQQRSNLPPKASSSGSDAVDMMQNEGRRPVRPSEMKDEGKLFVGGLSWDTTDEGLRKYFSEFGKVEDCTILRDQDGRSRGFAFLTFEDPSSVNAVMIREHILDGKAVDPKRAIPREEHLRNTRYFVGGLSHATTSDTMREFFTAYGKVVDCTVMVDRDSGRSKGFGFVTFEDASNTDQLVSNASLILDDKQIEVKVAQPRSQRDLSRNIRTTREVGFPGGDSGVPAVVRGMTGPQTAVNPQQISMFYQRMMGQMPMMGGMSGMGMNSMGMGMGMPAMGGGTVGMMPMNQMSDFGAMGGMGGNMAAGLGAGMGMGAGMGVGMGGMGMGGGMGGMGGGGNVGGGGMRMGMGPMAMNGLGMGMGMGMRPFMNDPAAMMRPMGMMGAAGPMGRARGGAMLNAGVGPARSTARGQHSFHPYAR